MNEITNVTINAYTSELDAILKQEQRMKERKVTGNTKRVPFYLSLTRRRK